MPNASDEQSLNHDVNKSSEGDDSGSGTVDKTLNFETETWETDPTLASGATRLGPRSPSRKQYKTRSRSKLGAVYRESIGRKYIT